MPESLASRWLPQLHLVSFGIDDPGELSVFGIVDLVENVAALFAQDFDQGVDILHPVVDQERRRARRKLVTVSRTNRPDGRSGKRLTFTVGPGESRASPFLDVDSEVPLVPSLQCRSVFGFEEDAANACDSLPGTSRSGGGDGESAFSGLGVAASAAPAHDSTGRRRPQVMLACRSTRRTSLEAVRVIDRVCLRTTARAARPLALGR